MYIQIVLAGSNGELVKDLFVMNPSEMWSLKYLMLQLLRNLFIVVGVRSSLLLVGLHIPLSLWQLHGLWNLFTMLRYIYKTYF